MSIKGLLIDSGGVLNGPITGHWMIPPRFFEFVDKEAFDRIPREIRRGAFRKAMDYIVTIDKMDSMDEEYEHFYNHYCILFENLDGIDVSNEIIRLIADDLVYNDKKYRFYDDVLKNIPKLSNKYSMAVVSDAWPSLQNVFDVVNFKQYFDSFIISCEVGVTKPHSMMYESALEDLNLKPDEVVFIDDRIRNCNGAKNAGIKNTILMCRSRKVYYYMKLIQRRHRVVKNFDDVIKFLDADATDYS